MLEYGLKTEFLWKHDMGVITVLCQVKVSLGIGPMEYQSSKYYSPGLGFTCTLSYRGSTDNTV